MTDHKSFITDYLRALSGRSKPADLLQKYVADPALAEHITQVEAAFPLYEIAAEAMLAEGGLVAVRARFRGCHRGTFAGIEATGRTVSFGLMIIYRIENNRIVQHWMEFDRLALLQQLQDSVAGAA